MSHLDPLTCEETFHRLEDYLDHELSAEEVVRVEAHLSICAECASEYRFEATVLTEIRMKVQRIQAPPGLISRIFLALPGSQE